MLEINKTEELIALSRALNFIKFKCEDNEARYLASSPIIGRLYKEVTEALKPYFEEKGSHNPENWPEIESIPEYLKTIERFIGHISQWNDSTEEVKLKIIKNLIFPYKFEEITVMNLLKFGNDFHK